MQTTRLFATMFLLATALAPSAAPESRLATADDPLPRAAAAADLISSTPSTARAAAVRATYAADGSLRFLGAPPSTGYALPSAPSPGDSARQFMLNHAVAFGLDSPATDLEATGIRVNGLRTHVRMRQTYAGLPVFGAGIVVQLHRKLGIECALSDVMRNTAALDTGKVSLLPRIDADEAVLLAQALMDRQAPDIPIIIDEGPDLEVFAPEVLGLGGLTRLAWSMVCAGAGAPHVRERVLIDAQTGQIFLHFSLVHTALDRSLYDSDNSADNPGTLVRAEGELPTSNAGNSHTGGTAIPDADDAYDFFGDTYDFYWNEHGRDSIDGAGMTISGTVRYCHPSFDCPMENAFWSVSRAYFGEGYAGADDVVAHELTHGVTQYESSLIYFGVSGAINEALSDIWGEFVDLSNGAGNDTASVRWLMGEDRPGGAIRDMADPPNHSQPDSTCSPLWWDVGYDYGGVHINAGVGNKLCYLLTDGDTFRGYTVSGMGISLVADLFYECQINLLSAASDYGDLYNALTQAAINLGCTTAQRTNIANACKAVAITPATSCQLPPDNDDCSGAFDMELDTDYTGSTVTATGTFHMTCDDGSGYDYDLLDYRDVWFRFTPETTQSFTISACGSDFDTTLVLFTGSCASLTSVACNNDACGVASVIVAELTADTPYFIRLSGYDSAVGAYVLRVADSASVDCGNPILSEGFDAGIPASWTLVDNDGLTPMVEGFDQAWMVILDPDNGTDIRAASTSYYDPSGQADDWLITPAINLDGGSVLQWEAASYSSNWPDGYEVRISTAGTQLSAFLANASLFSVDAESTLWGTRVVDLAAAGYSDQTVHIAFRNITDDGFFLMVDNIQVCGASEVDAEIGVSPTYYMFPNLAVGAGPSASVPFTISNAGPDALSIQSVTLTGVAAADFVIAGDTGESSLAAGATRTVDVAFDPQSVGNKVAYLTITSNDPTSPTLNVYLWGVAEEEPDITLTASSLDFGYRSLDTGSTNAQYLSIGNSGSGPLTVSSVGISGSHAADFAIVSDTGEISLASGASRTISVRFGPTAAGDRTAQLLIVSNDPDESPIAVNLSGAGVDPASGVVSPVWVDFAHDGVEEGSMANPFNSLAEGMDFVIPAGTVYVEPGNTSETPRITKAMRVEALSSAVRVGGGG